MGGAVNVISRTPTDEWNGSLTAMGGLREDGRGGETYQLGAYAGGPLVEDRLGLSLFAASKARANTPQVTNARLSDLEDRDTLTGSATLSWTPNAAQRIDDRAGRTRRPLSRHRHDGDDAGLLSLRRHCGPPESGGKGA